MNREPLGERLPEEDPRLIAAYQEASTDAPSLHTGEALRAAARRAAGARPQALGKFRMAAWQAPLAAAAIVVLSTTVVFWTVREEGLDKLSQPPSLGEASEPGKRSPPKITRQEKLAAKDAAPKPPPSSAPVSNRAATARSSATTAPTKKLDASPAAPPPAPAPRDQFAKEAGSAAASERAAELERSATERRGIAELDKRKVEQAQAGRADSEQKALLREEAPASAQVQTAPVTASAESQDSLAARARAGAAPALQDDGVEPPKPWIERIEHLLRDGQKTQAMEALVAFRKSYPAYTLPDALAELEREIQEPR
ncbi:MAG: hypothetical protein ACKVQA_16350 [Burkholderiales bacterium]